jgi:hypothetical protein
MKKELCNAHVTEEQDATEQLLSVFILSHLSENMWLLSSNALGYQFV